jgi:hypothetical protein
MVEQGEDNIHAKIWSSRSRCGATVAVCAKEQCRAKERSYTVYSKNESFNATHSLNGCAGENVRQNSYCVVHIQSYLNSTHHLQLTTKYIFLSEHYRVYLHLYDTLIYAEIQP